MTGGGGSKKSGKELGDTRVDDWGERNVPLAPEQTKVPRQLCFRAQQWSG